ncbi:hypothetical protein DFS34DRAFT_134893 [Phlyctochytrium arcticum]|nr:hypothetical protein DFS34DRAFT_134893 [Phlyctochytrium arcticum]
MTIVSTRTIGRVPRRRRQSTRQQNNSPAAAPLTPHDVYLAALRCCLYPALDSGVDKAAKPSIDIQKGPTPSSTGSSDRTLAEEARRAAEKFGIHYHVHEYEESINKGDTVKLASGTLRAFIKLLHARVEIFSGAMKDPRTGTFARAGGRILRERLGEGSNLGLLTDLRDLILCIGAYIDKELPKELTPEEHDKFLLLTAELFLAIVREAIQKAEVRNSVLHAPLLKDQDQLKVVLRSFMKYVPISGDSIDSSLADWLNVVFEMKKDEHRAHVVDARKSCTDKTTFVELKTLLDLMVKDDCPFARPSDFSQRQAYDSWKQREIHLLQVLLQNFHQRYPNSINARSSSSADPSSFLPSDPHAYYRMLLDVCLKHDMQHASAQDTVISLSKLSVAILSECSFRWRLSKEFKEIAFLDALVTYYQLGHLIEDDVFPKLHQLTKITGSFTQWRMADRDYYISVLDTLNRALHDKLRQFANMLGWKEKTPDGCNSTMQLITLILTTIREDRIWQDAHPEWASPGRLEEQVREELLEAINTRYRACSQMVADLPREIIRLTISVKAVNSDITNYRLYFREPIFGMSIMLIAAETCLKYFILEMENMRFSLQGDYQIAEMLDLYQVVKLLRDMCEESELSIVKDFDVESWFAPFISQWLALTDQRWVEWVKSAVDIEKYVPYMPPVSMHSTSVMDMYSCFHAGLEFIEKLAWRESGKKERLVKDFIKMMSKALQEYAQMMWDEFEAIDNENSDKPIEFSFQSCIKINNVVAAHLKLKDILQKLVKANAGHRKVDLAASRTEAQQDKATISVKVIRAANLQACDWTTSDPYVILSHGGTEIHRTRVIDKNLNPAWNQSFEIVVPHSLRDNESFLDLFVYDKDLIGKDDLCGEASVFLRDSKFDDFLSHDVEVSLKPQGKLLIRITRKGEIDDIAFWVSKAEETVRFCLEDMIRVYVEQLIRVARSTFSSVASSSGTKSSWSLPFSLGSTATSSPSVEDIQKALLPFLEYLDKTLSIFNGNIDRHLNEYLVDLWPSLAPPKKVVSAQQMKRSKTRAGKRGEEVKTMKRGGKGTGSAGNTPTSPDSEVTAANCLHNEIAEEELSRPSSVIKLIWQDLLSLVESTLSTFGADDKNKAERKIAASALRTRSSSLPQNLEGAAPVVVAPGVLMNANKPVQTLSMNGINVNLTTIKLSATERRAINCFTVIIEVLKSVFVCQIDGVECGYALAELEDARYDALCKLSDALLEEVKRREKEEK